MHSQPNVTIEPSNNFPSIVNIVILYNNENEVLEYARRVEEQRLSKNVQLVVVINKQGNSSISSFGERLIAIKKESIVLNPGRNLGYLKGSIWGYLKLFELQKTKPKWVIISNTDIRFAKENFFESLNNNNYNENFWCIAPSVYAPKKRSFENPEYINRLSIEKINRLITINSIPFIAYLYTIANHIRHSTLRRKKLNSQIIYSAKGCFFIFNPIFINILAESTNDVLLYSEESIVAELILKCKKHIYYDNSIEVIHDEGATTKLLGITKKSKYILSSLKFIRDEYY